VRKIKGITSVRNNGIILIFFGDSSKPNERRIVDIKQRDKPTRVKTAPPIFIGIGEERNNNPKVNKQYEGTKTQVASTKNNNPKKNLRIEALLKS
jgi:hypothetical protein